MHETTIDQLSLFPTRGDHNAKRTEKHENKEQGETQHETPRSKKHNITQSKNNTRTIALERSVA